MTSVRPVLGGPITLSDRRSQREWTVDVAPFRLGQTPVTQTEYAAVMAENPSAHLSDLCPVEQVSWWDAVLFCNALSEREGLQMAYLTEPETKRVQWLAEANGYRLPTEAEWELACRAGTIGPRYGELEGIGWYAENSGGQSHPVARKAANAWGFYDMLGNIWEWCWDIYDAEVYKTYRVLRGGGWADEHWSCRASVRRRSHPTFKIEDVGFRVARSAV